MNTVIVSTWQTSCGIAQHTGMLMDAVIATGFRGPQDGYSVSPELLDPHANVHMAVPDVLHLNYHMALHSRWTPEEIRQWRKNGVQVLVTLHDSGLPNSDQAKAICAAADYFVVHEPYDDLPAHGEYLRMGVPLYDGGESFRPQCWYQRPLLGTIGHDFGWKNWDELARRTAAVGWGMRICTPDITEAHATQLYALNPWLDICLGFWQVDALRVLHDCDATAFVNVCHNTGQSAAILQGIGARKPVLALQDCRQYRALFLDRLGRDTIRWVQDFDALECQLKKLPIQRVDPGIVALAEQESWEKVGKRYAEIYRKLVA